MRRAQALFMVLLLILPAAAQQSPQVPCNAPPAGVDPSVPMNQPDRYAWELFVQVNQKAPASFQHSITYQGKTFMTNSAVWETWPDDPWTFPTNPDPSDPPKWPDAPIAKRLHPKGKGNHLTHTADLAGRNDIILDTGGEEIHRNRATFDYVIQNNLWYTQGIAAFVAKGLPANFPTDSIEVKGNWNKIKESDKSKYHWNYDEQGNLWGLVAMHITSKALPNWFWATFEWVDNPGRCDYIGCSDCFGYQPSFVPSHTCPASGNCPANLVGQIYKEPTTITPGLDSLFAKAGYSGAWLGEYRHYRLKGSMTNFTTSTGQPILLGNSVTESSFLQTASCMTCHARAAVKADGTNAFPFFGEAPTLPLQMATPAQFQTQQTTYHGAPDPNWFNSYSDFSKNEFQPTVTPIATQLDFVWAIPFQAHAAKTSTTKPSSKP
ncbi:MAG: hypothetical protein JO197_04380 [Acidobacteria bacterium]|nr:hypothetical protein [Acidobacteriota bacterium]MBV9478548.1 hypothetical protein [Acidobacteriota bacterium]